MILKKKRELKWSNDQSWVNIKEGKRVRCPTCNRRLLPREVYDSLSGQPNSNESIRYYKIPPHKTRKNI